jgi:hypothetical protein
VLQKRYQTVLINNTVALIVSRSILTVCQIRISHEEIVSILNACACLLPFMSEYPALSKCYVVLFEVSQTWGITIMSILRLQTYFMYVMKMLDCIKNTICSAYSHLQWSAASVFCVTHHPSIAPCDMLLSLVCKPNFACGEASDHSVAEQRFLC